MENCNTYKEMYLKLFRATEAAINCLIDAQRQCEEMYISAEDAEDAESQITAEAERIR